MKLMLARCVIKIQSSAYRSPRHPFTYNRGCNTFQGHHTSPSLVVHQCLYCPVSIHHLLTQSFSHCSAKTQAKGKKLHQIAAVSFNAAALGLDSKSFFGEFTSSFRLQLKLQRLSTVLF